MKIRDLLYSVLALWSVAILFPVVYGRPIPNGTSEPYKWVVDVTKVVREYEGGISNKFYVAKLVSNIVASDVPRNGSCGGEVDSEYSLVRNGGTTQCRLPRKGLASDPEIFIPKDLDCVEGRNWKAGLGPMCPKSAELGFERVFLRVVDTQVWFQCFNTTMRYGSGGLEEECTGETIPLNIGDRVYVEGYEIEPAKLIGRMVPQRSIRKFPTRKPTSKPEMMPIPTESKPEATVEIKPISVPNVPMKPMVVVAIPETVPPTVSEPASTVSKVEEPVLTEAVVGSVIPTTVLPVESGPVVTSEIPTAEVSSTTIQSTTPYYVVEVSTSNWVVFWLLCLAGGNVAICCYLNQRARNRLTFQQNLDHRMRQTIFERVNLRIRQTVSSLREEMVRIEDWIQGDVMPLMRQFQAVWELLRAAGMVEFRPMDFVANLNKRILTNIRKQLGEEGNTEEDDKLKEVVVEPSKSDPKSTEQKIEDDCSWTLSSDDMYNEVELKKVNKRLAVDNRKRKSEESDDFWKDIPDDESVLAQKEVVDEDGLETPRPNGFAGVMNRGGRRLSSTPKPIPPPRKVRFEVPKTESVERDESNVLDEVVVMDLPDGIDTEMDESQEEDAFPEAPTESELVDILIGGSSGGVNNENQTQGETNRYLSTFDAPQRTEEGDGVKEEEEQKKTYNLRKKK